MPRTPRPARYRRRTTRPAAPETWTPAGLVAPLFVGQLPVARFFPCPAQPPAERAAADPLLAKTAAFLAAEVDGEWLDAEGQIPPEVLAGVRELGLFGITIPVEYGGLGLSTANYLRIIQLVASHSSVLAALLVTHHSLGLPGLLLAGGDDRQRAAFLPRLAAGAASTLACGEAPAGLLPTPLAATATPSEDGSWLLSGESLWVCSGLSAELLAVPACSATTPAGMPEFSLFLVDTAAAEFAAQAECRFMAIRGVPIGVARFRDLHLPAGHLLGGPGGGAALLRQGRGEARLAMAAATGGAMKQSLAVATAQLRREGSSEWAGELLAASAADLYAAESLVWLSAALAGRPGGGRHLEGALAGLFCSGARRRSTAAAARLCGALPAGGERLPPAPVLPPLLEEGDDALRELIAAEVLGQLRQMNPPTITFANLKAWLARYTRWYLRLYRPNFRLDAEVQLAEALRPHLHLLERDVRRLGRDFFHAGLRHRRQLAERQLLLARLVDCAVELFAAAAVLARAALPSSPGEAATLADLFCRQSRQRLGELRRRLRTGDDDDNGRLSRALCDGYYAWLTDGTVGSWRARGGR